MPRNELAGALRWATATLESSLPDPVATAPRSARGLWPQNLGGKHAAIRTFGPKIDAHRQRMPRNGLAGARRDGDLGRISGPFLSGPNQALLREPEPETTTRRTLS